MNKIKITDITLKELAKEREIALLFREKTAIAACADSLGVDAIELAPIKRIREDTIIYKTISQNIHNAVVAIPVGFSDDDIAVAWECVKDAKNPRLQIEVPVSTVQMEYTYHIKAEKMIEKISTLVEKAKELCGDVEFAALDATRADIDFLINAIKAAEAGGANIITICDDAGISLPEEISRIIETVKNTVKIPVYIKISDRINMGVASAIAAIEKGADGVKCSMSGETALLTGEFSDAINTCSAQIGVATNLKNTKIHTSIKDMLTSINNEAYNVEDEMDDKNKILLDSNSSISQVAQAANILGYDLSDSDCGNVYKALMQVCEKKGVVEAKELEALIASNAMQAPSTYHLESYTTSTGNLTTSMTQVTLKCNDEILCGVSIGDGTVDSAFRAIERCIGHHYELDNFQIQSVTEGKDALGSAVVRLRNNGKLYSGIGTSTDIIAASIRAYINALNKIIFEEA